jgi:hypothetical protein
MNRAINPHIDSSPGLSGQSQIVAVRGRNVKGALSRMPIRTPLLVKRRTRDPFVK